MNVLAARSAATRRVGCTSLASIDPERSSTSITDASLTGTLVVTCGRAIANASEAIAASAAADRDVAAPVGPLAERLHERRHRREAQRVAPGAPAGQPLRLQCRRHEQQREQPHGGGEAHLRARAFCLVERLAASSSSQSPSVSRPT